jgi:hypothetical protein
MRISPFHSLHSSGRWNNPLWGNNNYSFWNPIGEENADLLIDEPCQDKGANGVVMCGLKVSYICGFYSSVSVL